MSGVVGVGKTPHWVAASSDGRLAYVANEGSGDVSVVDIETRAVLATIPVGQAPRKIAVQPAAAAGRRPGTRVHGGRGGRGLHLQARVDHGTAG